MTRPNTKSIWLMKSFVALVCLCLVPLSFAADEDSLIVPGRGVGKITLGMEHNALIKLLGTPTREDDLEDRNENAEMKDLLRDDWVVSLPVPDEANSPSGRFMADFVTVYSRDRKVVQIEVRGKRFKTQSGLSIISTGLEWKKAFPGSTFVHHQFHHASAGGWPAPKIMADDDDAKAAGIAWRLIAMGSASPDTDPAEPVDVIMVHAPNVPLIVDPDAQSRFIWKDDPHRLSGR